MQQKQIADEPELIGGGITCTRDIRIYPARIPESAAPVRERIVRHRFVNPGLICGRKLCAAQKRAIEIRFQQMYGTTSERSLRRIFCV